MRELHRDDLFQTLQAHPEVAISLLKVLFERLREADATILQLYRSHPELVPFQPARLGAVPTQSTPVVSLQGLTPQASSALPETPFRITAFPFRIGRRCHDPLVHNELAIPDAAPLQISRHHLALIKHDGRIGVADPRQPAGRVAGRQAAGRSGGTPWSALLYRHRRHAGAGESMLTVYIPRHHHYVFVSWRLEVCFTSHCQCSRVVPGRSLVHDVHNGPRGIVRALFRLSRKGTRTRNKPCGGAVGPACER